MATHNTDKLWRIAQNLAQQSGNDALPPLWFLTDADRVSDTLAVVRNLPTGAGVILRDYDAPGRPDLARALARNAQDKGLMLLVGRDAALAKAVGAHGVHLPEALTDTAPAIKRDHPDFIVTAAAHSLNALQKAARMGADAAFLSPIFPTGSHPGTPTLGPVKTGLWVRQAKVPVFGLGGIDAKTAPRLNGTGLAGFGAIGGLI